MQVKSLRRTVLVVRWGTILLVTGGVAACAGAIVGGEFPLTAILMVHAPVATGTRQCDRMDDRVRQTETGASADGPAWV